MSGTLDGRPMLRCALTVPRWGIWHADAVVASGEAIAVGTRVVVELGGATYSGTVRSGGVWREEGRYRIVGGAGGWSTELRDRSYQSALGVRRDNVVADAARECGETLGDTWDDARLGPHFARPAGEASLVLDAVAPESWHVDGLGDTQLGVRAPAAFGLPYVVAERHDARGVLVVQAEGIAGLVPGATLEGIEVASVRHELTEGGIRSVLWAHRDSLTDRLAGAVRALVRWFTRETAYHRLVEYRVVKVSSGLLDLRPVRASTGAPALVAVPMVHGVPGTSAEPQTGSTCLVVFVDGDPTRPMVVAYEGPTGAAYRPDVLSILADELTLGDSEMGVANPAGRFVRYGDSVTFGAPGPGTLLIGAPAPVSRARG